MHLNQICDYKSNSNVYQEGGDWYLQLLPLGTMASKQNAFALSHVFWNNLPIWGVQLKIIVLPSCFPIAQLHISNNKHTAFIRWKQFQIPSQKYAHLTAISLSSCCLTQFSAALILYQSADTDLAGRIFSLWYRQKATLSFSRSQSPHIPCQAMPANQQRQ